MIPLLLSALGAHLVQSLANSMNDATVSVSSYAHWPNCVLSVLYPPLVLSYFSIHSTEFPGPRERDLVETSISALIAPNSLIFRLLLHCGSLYFFPSVREGIFSDDG